jgi:hypothetical protein
MVLSGPGNDAATGATHACAASAAPSSLPPSLLRTRRHSDHRQPVPSARFCRSGAARVSPGRRLPPSAPDSRLVRRRGRALPRVPRWRSKEGSTSEPGRSVEPHPHVRQCPQRFQQFGLLPKGCRDGTLVFSVCGQSVIACASRHERASSRPSSRFATRSEVAGSAWRHRRYRTGVR